MGRHWISNAMKYPSARKFYETLPREDMEQERKRELAQEVTDAQRDNKCSREDYYDETDE